MVTPRQGDVWWAETEAGRRPVLVVTRSRAADTLRRVVVAPVTRRVRRLPTEVSLGIDEGLREGCVASFDNLQVVLRAYMTDRVGSLGPRRFEICRALSALADC
jgi:mRNA interferase MazF